MMIAKYYFSKYYIYEYMSSIIVPLDANHRRFSVVERILEENQYKPV